MTGGFDGERDAATQGHRLPTLALRIDAACDRYERAWREGARPEIQEYVAVALGPERTPLLRELLALDLELRRDCGECLTPHDYRARFPGFEDQVDEAFGLYSSIGRTTQAVTTRGGPSSRAIPALPGYEILGVLGRGGMGVVYRGRQIQLDRPCALKMILGGSHASPEAKARFLAEAQTIARLRHPNVLQIHGIGEVDGSPFLELEFADGGSLAQRLDGTPWKPRDATALIGVLARAVGDMHRLGVVHRDLKPANVLLTADGTPKVADFGLAKTLGGAIGGPASESIAGTPCYMSPEQADGRGSEVGPAADVHALGVMLYELVTGRLPFRAASLLETLEQVKSADPVPPSHLVPGLPRDIETVCLKSLNKEAVRRYDTAHALAEDLQRWQAGKPVLARRAGPVERAWRWGRRNTAIATAVAMSSLLVVCGICSAVFWWNQISVAAATAREKVEMLMNAETANVPQIVDQLTPFRRWVDPLLARAARECRERSKTSLHIALAMLPVDPSQKDFLGSQLTEAATRPVELLVIREALLKNGHSQSIKSRLWAEFHGQSLLNDSQLRSAGALAGFDPNNSRWNEVGKAVAARLVRENPMLLGRWLDVFRPVGGSLSGPLLESYYDRLRPDARATAEGFLLDFADRPDNPTQPEDFANLIVDADIKSFESMLGILEAHPQRTRAVDRLLSILARPADRNGSTARLQGRAAAALVRLGYPEQVWPILKRTECFSACTELIHDLAEFGVAPDAVVARLEVEPDASARRALVLALGEYPCGRIPDEKRRSLVARLVLDYRRERDPGLHSAIDWLLRQVWKQADVLERIDKEVSGQQCAEDRDWFVNSQGQTFTLVRGPVELLVGSPDDEPHRYEDESRRQVRIDRTFAIATREVTVEQYPAFLTPATGVKRGEALTSAGLPVSPTPQCPAVDRDWYDAARYCNWLSEQDGIPQSQWCYPLEIKEGMFLPGDCLERTGYRLPTELEWEYACRAGSSLSRPGGVSDSRLSKYCWYRLDPTSPIQNHPVGLLKPNDLGLFDMLGNAWEWTLDPFVREPGRATPGGVVSADVQRVLRGGAIDCSEAYLRSAMRHRLAPQTHNGSVGFRVARTLRLNSADRINEM